MHQNDMLDSSCALKDRLLEQTSFSLFLYSFLLKWYNVINCRRQSYNQLICTLVGLLFVLKSFSAFLKLSAYFISIFRQQSVTFDFNFRLFLSRFL